MGFKLAVNLYGNRAAPDVTDALHRFYQAHGAKSLAVYEDLYKDTQFRIHETVEIYDFAPRWVLTDIFAQPEDWIRERHLFVSRELSCPGFFVFEYDGDYWGYEFFANGKVLDRFTSNASYRWYFEGLDCQGNVSILANTLPHLHAQDIEPYLVRLPDYEVVPMEEYEQVQEDTDIFPRPGDEFKRWDECAVLNFLRMLGIRGAFTGKWGRFEFAAPLFAEIDSEEFR